MRPPIRTPSEIAPSLEDNNLEERSELSITNANVVSDDSDPESEEASLSDAANVISDESSEEEEEEEDEESSEDEPSEASSVAESVSKKPKRFAQLRIRR